jgi:hypothetical protein
MTIDGSLISGWNKVSSVRQLTFLMHLVSLALLLMSTTGLYRDMFTHKITTPEHYNMLMMPFIFKREELDYDLVVGTNTVVTPSYDPHCTNGDVSGGCLPVAVISAEKLLDHSEGPAETARIANALLNNPKMSPYVIGSEAWECIWSELIIKGKGAKTVVDRPSTPYTEADYNFSAEMLEEMLVELDRLLTKYDSTDWISSDIAIRLVELLTWHRGLIQTELDELNSGRRNLSANDFLGPKERKKRRLENQAGSKEPLKMPNTKFFDARAKERMVKKRRDARKAQRINERRAEKSDLKTKQARKNL